MLKKLMVGTLVTVLSTGIALGSVSAKEFDGDSEGGTLEHQINLEVQGGIVDFSLDGGTYEMTIDQTETAFKLDPTEELTYSAVDNRGIDDEGITITYGIEPFVNDDDPESTFEATAFGPTELAAGVNANNETVAGDIDVTVEEFIQKGNYSTNLTATVEFAAPVVD